MNEAQWLHVENFQYLLVIQNPLRYVENLRDFYFYTLVHLFGKWLDSLQVLLAAMTILECDVKVC